MAFCRDRHGFTLIELIVVVGIVAVLATTALPAYTNYLQTVRNGRSVADIHSIDTSIVAYTMDKSMLPVNFSDIGAAANQRDPWNRLYVYKNLALDHTPLEYSNGTALNDDYDLYSLGLDGLSAPAYDDNGKDDIARQNNGQYVGLRNQEL